VQIPIKAFKAIQHSYSIYKFCIYSRTPHSPGAAPGRKLWARAERVPAPMFIV
jgi:hypothetical protein